jgi:hypothetical protein
MRFLVIFTVALGNGAAGPCSASRSPAISLAPALYHGPYPERLRHLQLLASGRKLQGNHRRLSDARPLSPPLLDCGLIGAAGWVTGRAGRFAVWVVMLLFRGVHVMP